jgi:hypothetical protein
MRQRVNIQEHFKRGNACSHLDCRAAIPVLGIRNRHERGRSTRDGASHHPGACPYSVGAAMVA